MYIYIYIYIYIQTLTFHPRNSIVCNELPILNTRGVSSKPQGTGSLNKSTTAMDFVAAT